MNTVVDQEEVNPTEQTLWTEMLGRWKQILKAVSANRVAPDRAFEIFKETFRDRIYTRQECGGKGDRFSSDDAVEDCSRKQGSFVEPYFQWIQIEH